MYTADGQVLGGARQKFTFPEESQYGQHKGLRLVSLQQVLYYDLISGSVGEIRGRLTVFIMGQCLLLII